VAWTRPTIGWLGVALVVPLLASACSETSADESQTPGEIARVFTNGKIYTVDDRNPWVESVGVDSGGVIVALGTNQEVLSSVPASAEVVNLDGQFAMPGIQDPHEHVLEAGINLNACLLPERRALRAYERPIAQCAQDQPRQTWVRAAGAPASEFPDTGRELPVDVLDRASPDRPAIILDDLGHSVWTNSLGLAAAGINSTTPDPDGGEIGRDPNTGRLTGVLFEDAQHLIRDLATEDPEVGYAGLQAGLAVLRRNGITSVSDAGGYWTQGHPEQWQRALDRDELSVRARNSIYIYAGEPVDEQLAEAKKRFSYDPDSLLTFNMAKIYVDGILDLGTAYLLEPTPEDTDKGYFQPDVLNRYVAELHEAGFQIKFHVIGDAAAREALNAIEMIPADREDVAARKHHLTHTYLVAESDRPRFKELGVGADFQMAPDVVAESDFDGLTLIPARSILNTGALVTLSSDYDADPISPWGTLERALTRGDEAFPDLASAVAAMTIKPAELLRQQDRTGSLEIGKLADMVVLDRDIFEVEPRTIGQATVTRTILGGETIYQRQ